MMKKVKIFQVDAFTRQLFCGNPAGVVLDAAQLDVREMQQIARELNNSETAFILPARSPDHDCHIRYFTPTAEVPICGHATIAALYVYAREGRGKQDKVRVKTQVGILEMQLKNRDGDLTVEMQQGALEFQQPLAPELVQSIARALGVRREALLTDSPVQIVSTGHSKVMIPMRNREDIDELQPDFTALKQISRRISCNGFFVYTVLERSPEVRTYGRMFAPAIGIHEDPVTGNANGPLGAYLVAYGLVPVTEENFQMIATQGEAVGRPGRMRVKVKIAAGKPRAVKIEGSAVVVYSTELAIQ